MNAIVKTRERPILFSAEMVRALLAGTKTQTRRIIKVPPASSLICQAYDPHELIWDHEGAGLATRVPYHKGDRLWVREAFYSDTPRTAEYQHVHYRADAAHRHMRHGQTLGADGKSGYTGPWKPGIHMPRWASRITLEITDVRVQRVQEISEEDARAEGVGKAYAYDEAEEGLYSPDGVDRGAGCGYMPPRSHYVGFADLWDRINGKRPGCSWDANPWCWAITFKRVEPA